MSDTKIEWDREKSHPIFRKQVEELIKQAQGEYKPTSNIKPNIYDPNASISTIIIPLQKDNSISAIVEKPQEKAIIETRSKQKKLTTGRFKRRMINFALGVYALFSLSGIQPTPPTTHTQPSATIQQAPYQQDCNLESISSIQHLPLHNFMCSQTNLPVKETINIAYSGTTIETQTVNPQENKGLFWYAQGNMKPIDVKVSGYLANNNTLPEGVSSIEEFLSSDSGKYHNKIRKDVPLKLFNFTNHYKTPLTLEKTSQGYKRVGDVDIYGSIRELLVRELSGQNVMTENPELKVLKLTPITYEHS